MPIYEDEAIVLRQYPLADFDAIVVLIGPGLGKIRAVAQGVKKPKSRLAGCLQPLSHVRLVLYSREGRELGRIRDAELLHSYCGRINSLSHIFALTYFAELVHALVQENQPSPILFRLLLASLKAGEKCVPVLPLIRYFEVWCLKLSGFYPNYAYCSNCGKYVKEEGFFARINDGTSFCVRCADTNDVHIGVAASGALRAILARSPEDFAGLPMGSDVCLQLEHLTQGLLRLHTDIPLKSYRILKDALD